MGKQEEQESVWEYIAEHLAVNCNFVTVFFGRGSVPVLAGPHKVDL